MRRALVLLALLASFPSPSHAQIAGQPGAFSRMGFGARGMGMGNAMTAVTEGLITGYYNPALIAWSTNRNASASFGILSLDRSLNFLHYTQPVPPMAAVSVGIINAGVSNIDGRDADAEPTGPLRTSENQVFLGFGARFKSGLSLGLNFKLYYYHLYTDVSSTTIGLDLGALYAVLPSLTVGLAVHDINSKYKWDTSTLYGTQGNSSSDGFPLLVTLGVAYRVLDSLALVTGDLEFSNASTATLRLGAEVPIIPEVTVRAGVDRIDLKEKGTGLRPAFGFTVGKTLEGWTPALNYAYVFEPFSPTGLHMISLSVMF